MKMKKIVAGVVAAVLSMALCAPAFAATPGEVADDNAREVIGLTQNWNEAGQQCDSFHLHDFRRPVLL